MEKKRILREVKILLAALCVGMVLMPVISIIILSPKPSVHDYYEYISTLFSGEPLMFVAWLFTLTPYLLILFIRAIVRMLK